MVELAPDRRGRRRRVTVALVVAALVVVAGLAVRVFLHLNDGFDYYESQRHSPTSPGPWDSDQSTVESTAVVPFLGRDGSIGAATLQVRAADYLRWGTGLTLWVDAPDREPFHVDEFRFGYPETQRGLAVVALAEVGAPTADPRAIEALVVGRSPTLGAFHARVSLAAPAAPSQLHALRESPATGAWRTIEQVVAVADGAGEPELQLLVRDWNLGSPPLRAIRLRGERRDGRWQPSALEPLGLPGEFRDVTMLHVRSASLPRAMHAIVATPTGLEVLRSVAGKDIELLPRGAEVALDGHRATLSFVRVDAAFRARARPFRPEHPRPPNGRFQFPPLRDRLLDGLDALVLDPEGDATPPWFVAGRAAWRDLGFLDAAVTVETVASGNRNWIDATPWLRTEGGATHLEFLERASWRRPSVAQRWWTAAELTRPTTADPTTPPAH